MFKLKHSVYKRLASSSPSSNDIDFILYLTKNQNDMGQAVDIDYKEVCMELGISKQTFYNMIKRIEEKEIIQISYANKRTWDFILFDNIFVSEKNLKEGYLNTNRDFLYSNDFKELKAGAKLLILYLLFHPQKSPKVSKEQLMNNLGINCISVLEDYLNSISSWFLVRYSNDNNNVVFIKKDNIEVNDMNPANKQNFISRLKRWCFNNKVCFSWNDLESIYYLYYRFGAIKNVFYDFLVAISLKYNSLEPALINKFLTKCYDWKNCSSGILASI